MGGGLKKIPELDGLRAFAITAVMGFHFISPLISGGTLGVDVFFVLSGWLITSILVGEAEATGRIDYRAFLMRRARRLLPALGVLLAIYALAAPMLVPKVADRRWLDIGTAAFYVTNMRETFWPANTPLSHTWSLAIEEQFYILWPLALPALLFLGRQRAALILVGVWAAITFTRQLSLELWPGPAAYYFTPLHATGLVLGAALALRPVATSLGRIAMALLVALVIAGHTSVTFPYLQPIAELATAVVIAHPPRLLAARPLQFLGKISYGIYLWHIPLRWAFRLEGAAGLATLFVASILAGWLSHILVERWFLRPRGAAAAATSSASVATSASTGA